MIDKPACLSSVVFLFDGVCVQANKNKMPEGPLFKASQAGDVEASIAVIGVTGQLQTKPRPPTLYHHHIKIFIYPGIIMHSYCTHAHATAHTPQEVRKLLASGIKPDAERDEVSVFLD